MTVVIGVTEDEVREVAELFEAEALIMSPAVGLSPRVAFTVKKMKTVKDKAGERLVNVGVDQGAFRAVMCERFGDREKFRYTHVAQSWDGNDNLIEYVAPVERIPRGPLSEEHKEAMAEGRRRAAEERKALTEKYTPTPKVKPKVAAPKDAGEYYTSVSCRACGGPIKKTGKKGRPPVKCESCRNETPTVTIERPFGEGFYKNPCSVCGEPIAFTGTRGKQPSKHEGCVPATNGHAPKVKVVPKKVVRPAKNDAAKKMVNVPVGMSALEALMLLKEKA